MIAQPALKLRLYRVPAGIMQHIYYIIYIRQSVFSDFSREVSASKAFLKERPLTCVRNHGEEWLVLGHDDSIDGQKPLTLMTTSS